MPDIRRFGPGNRRTDPPPNCRDIHAAIILNQDNAFVVELHFLPGGTMWEHAADHPILFTVIEGRGKVKVSGEEASVEAGQAVLWPAGQPHNAWAEDTPFTAILFHYNMPGKQS